MAYCDMDMASQVYLSIILHIYTSNLLIPKFLKWTLSTLNLEMYTDAKGFQSNTKNRMTSCVDPNETTPYEPFHLYLHCWQMYLVRFARLKGLIVASHIRKKVSCKMHGF